MSVKSLKDLQPEPIELKICYPASDEQLVLDDGTVPTLQVGGFFTKQYKQEAKKYWNKEEDSEAKTAEDSLVLNARMISATIVDWSPSSFWDPDGDGNFTVEKMQKVLEEYDWMIIQLMEVLKDNRKFFRGNKSKSSGSTKAQSKSRVSGQ